MSIMFPSMTATFEDGAAVALQPMKIDLLRLERIEKTSIARLDVGLDVMYKLAWLALQRQKHPAVAPHLDLSSLSLERLCAGVDALAEVADIDIDDDEAEVGKASDPDPSTG